MPHICRNDLTADDLRRQLRYNPETGSFTRITVGTKPISLKPNSNGYLRIRVNGVLYKAHRLAWLHFHGEWPTQNIDHLNGDRTDNRISNLRDVSHRENQNNLRSHRGELTHKSDSAKGRPRGTGTIYPHKDSEKFVAQYRGRYLGCFETVEAAERAILLVREGTDIFRFRFQAKGCAFYHPKTGKWIASIKKQYLGSFMSEDLAKRAIKEWLELNPPSIEEIQCQRMA